MVAATGLVAGLIAASGAPAASGSIVGPAAAPACEAGGPTESAIRAFSIPGFIGARNTAVPAGMSQAANRVTPGVVSIVANLASQNASSAGTGMVVSSSGEVLTNNHVIQNAASITVTVAGTGQAYSASVIGTDPADDVAVLQLHGASGLPTVPIGNSSVVTVGDPVAAIGNATGGAPEVVSGNVTALNQSITATDPGGGNAEQLKGLIKTNVAIRPGFSGGPLVNAAGEVIGMDTAATVFNEYLPAQMRGGYAIPINHALTVAQRIESGRSVPAARSARLSSAMVANAIIPAVGCQPQSG